MNTPIHRRELLLSAGAAAALAATAPAAAAADAAAPQPTRQDEPFVYCLNTSTIRGQKLSLPQTIQIAAKAGYGAIEPWIREIQQFVQQGGKLSDVKKQIGDAGLTVESAIGFSRWIVDDLQERSEALEQVKSDMDLVRQIGGTRIAAPPVGATRQTDLDLWQAAKRYRALLEVGEAMGVTPQLELWGFSKSLSRLGEVAFVATESGHAKACLLPDVYHIYKGGSDFVGLRMIEGRAMHAFHMNDYPADPPREKIGDADRVHVGDGVAPIADILRTLYDNGFRGALSLELFNRTYWQQDALSVARTGLEKMRAAVLQSING